MGSWNSSPKSSDSESAYACHSWSTKRLVIHLSDLYKEMEKEMNANNPLIQQKFSEENPSMYKAVRISEICPICKLKRATLMKIPAPALAVAALVQRGHNHLLAAFLSPSS
jgi:hypothetical protein